MAHRLSRYAVAAAAVTALAGASVVTAAPAQAVNGSTVTFTFTSNRLVAVNELSYFPLGPTFLFPAPISRVVDGSAQVVASGSGMVTYQCQGTAINTYTAVGQELTVPCG